MLSEVSVTPCLFVFCGTLATDHAAVTCATHGTSPDIFFERRASKRKLNEMPQIFITQECGDSITLEVDPETDTVGSVKEKILDKTGFTVKQQILKYDNLFLSSCMSLSYYKIKAEAALYLIVQPDELEITLERAVGEPLVLKLPPETSVQATKERCEVLESVPVAKQRIKYRELELRNMQILFDLTSSSNRKSLTFQLDVLFDITLEVYTGLVFSIQVASNERVDVLQGAVNRRGRIPYHHQEMVYDGRIMEYGQRISDYGVRDNSIIVVNLRYYETMVFIKTLTGQTIMLMITPLDTVGDVKRKIERQEGYDFDRQRLIFVGEQLNDAHRLLDYRIEHESAIHLILRTGNGFEIYVDAPSGRSHNVEVIPSDTMVQVKQRLRMKEGIPVDIQVLHFNGELLEDTTTVAEATITSQVHLQMTINDGRTSQVFVSVNGRNASPLWVNLDHTIAQVKVTLAENVEIPVELQELYFAREKLEDSRTLRSYTIEDNHMLHLQEVRPPMLEFRVNLPDGIVMEIHDPSNETVHLVKQELVLKSGVPVPQQQLFFEGRELENSQTLGQCGIKDGSVLEMIPLHTIASNEPVGMNLFIKTLTGKTIMLVIHPTDKIGDLKERIRDKEGVPLIQQCLVVAGKQLKNDMTVSDCGIQNQSVLHLILRVPSQGPITVSIETENAHSFDLDTSLAETIEGLKGKIQDHQGVQIANQTLRFNEQELSDNDQTLGSYEVTDGATLTLSTRTPQ